MKKGLLNQKADPNTKNSDVRSNKSLDPETQEQIDIFMANGMRIVHNQKASDGIIQKIVNADDPIAEIAEATLDVVNRLEDSAVKKGIQLSQDVLVAGSNQLMGEIINMAEMAGMEKLTDDERGQAFSLAVSRYLDGAVEAGKLSKDQLVAMGEGAAQSPEGQKLSQDVGKIGAENTEGV